MATETFTPGMVRSNPDNNCLFVTKSEIRNAPEMKSAKVTKNIKLSKATKSSSAASKISNFVDTTFNTFSGGTSKSSQLLPSIQKTKSHSALQSMSSSTSKHTSITKFKEKLKRGTPTSNTPKDKVRLLPDFDNMRADFKKNDKDSGVKHIKRNKAAELPKHANNHRKNNNANSAKFSTPKLKSEVDLKNSKQTVNSKSAKVEYNRKLINRERDRELFKNAIVPDHLVDSVSEYNTDSEDRRDSPKSKVSSFSSARRNRSGCKSSPGQQHGKDSSLSSCSTFNTDVPYNKNTYNFEKNFNCSMTDSAKMLVTKSNKKIASSHFFMKPNSVSENPPKPQRTFTAFPNKARNVSEDRKTSKPVIMNEKPKAHSSKSDICGTSKVNKVEKTKIFTSSKIANSPHFSSRKDSSSYSTGNTPHYSTVLPKALRGKPLSAPKSQSEHPQQPSSLAGTPKATFKNIKTIASTEKTDLQRIRRNLNATFDQISTTFEKKNRVSSLLNATHPLTSTSPVVDPKIDTSNSIIHLAKDCVTYGKFNNYRDSLPNVGSDLDNQNICNATLTGLNNSQALKTNSSIQETTGSKHYANNESIEQHLLPQVSSTVNFKVLNNTGGNNFHVPPNRDIHNTSNDASYAPLSSNLAHKENNSSSNKRVPPSDIYPTLLPLSSQQQQQQTPSLLPTQETNTYGRQNGNGILLSAPAAPQNDGPSRLRLLSSTISHKNVVSQELMTLSPMHTQNRLHTIQTLDTRQRQTTSSPFPHSEYRSFPDMSSDLMTDGELSGNPSPPNFTVHPTIPELPEATPSITNSTSSPSIPENEKNAYETGNIPWTHQTFINDKSKSMDSLDEVVKMENVQNTPNSLSISSDLLSSTTNDVNKSAYSLDYLCSENFYGDTDSLPLCDSLKKSRRKTSKLIQDLNLSTLKGKSSVSFDSIINKGNNSNISHLTKFYEEKFALQSESPKKSSYQNMKNTDLNQKQSPNNSSNILFNHSLDNSVIKMSPLKRYTTESNYSPNKEPSQTSEFFSIMPAEKECEDTRLTNRVSSPERNQSGVRETSLATRICEGILPGSFPFNDSNCKATNMRESCHSINPTKNISISYKTSKHFKNSGTEYQDLKSTSFNFPSLNNSANTDNSSVIQGSQMNRIQLSNDCDNLLLPSAAVDNYDQPESSNTGENIRNRGSNPLSSGINSATKSNSIACNSSKFSDRTSHLASSSVFHRNNKCYDKLKNETQILPKVSEQTTFSNQQLATFKPSTVPCNVPVTLSSLQNYTFGSPTASVTLVTTSTASVQSPVTKLTTHATQLLSEALVTSSTSASTQASATSATSLLAASASAMPSRIAHPEPPKTSMHSSSRAAELSGPSSQGNVIKIG